MRAQQLECRNGWVVANLRAAMGRAKDSTSQVLPTSSPATTQAAAPRQRTPVTPDMRGSWQPRSTLTCSRYMREPSAAVACQVSPKIGLKGFAHRVKARWKPAGCSICRSGRLASVHGMCCGVHDSCRIAQTNLQHSVNRITRPLACTRLALWHARVLHCFAPGAAPCSTPAMKYVTTHCSRSTGSFDWAASCRKRGYTWCSRGSMRQHGVIGNCGLRLARCA